MKKNLQNGKLKKLEIFLHIKTAEHKYSLVFFESRNTNSLTNMNHRQPAILPIFFLKMKKGAERFKAENFFNLRKMTKRQRKRDSNSMFMMQSHEFQPLIFPTHPHHRILLELKSKLEKVLPPIFRRSPSTDIVHYLSGRVEHPLSKTVPDTQLKNRKIAQT